MGWCIGRKGACVILSYCHLLLCSSIPFERSRSIWKIQSRNFDDKRNEIKGRNKEIVKTHREPIPITFFNPLEIRE